MGKKSKAPEYSGTKADTGLWGSSTTDKSGTAYTAPDWASNTMSTVTSNINPTLNNMLSNDYANDPNFQVYQNQLYNTMGQQYDQMMGNLADRGLMRSTGLQALNNNYAQALQDNVASLYDNYYNRQSDNLSNLLNTSNTLYDYMTGTTALSKNDADAINQYNLAKYKINNSSNSNIGAIIGGLGQIAGSVASMKGGS